MRGETEKEEDTKARSDVIAPNPEWNTYWAHAKATCLLFLPTLFLQPDRIKPSSAPRTVSYLWAEKSQIALASIN